MMKRTLFGLLASVTVAGTLVAAQANPAPASPPQQPSSPASAPAQRDPAPAPAQKPAEISITGCLVQGSSPTVFILENARAGAASTAKPTSYVLEVASGSKVEFRPELNHQVTIVGVAETKAGAPSVAPGQKMAEKDMATLSAKTIVKVADTCPAA